MRISDWSSDVCSSDLPFAQCEERESHQRTLAAHLGQQRTVEREKTALDRNGVIQGRAAPVRTQTTGQSTKMRSVLVAFPPLSSPHAAQFDPSLTAFRRPCCTQRFCSSQSAAL